MNLFLKSALKHKTNVSWSFYGCKNVDYVLDGYQTLVSIYMAITASQPTPNFTSDKCLPKWTQPETKFTPHI
jgi:hypothetical protein